MTEEKETEKCEDETVDRTDGEVLGFYKSNCTESYKALKKVEQLYNAHKKEWKYWKQEYEYLDRKMAEKDGRLTVCKSPDAVVRSSKPANLTRAQLMDIAARLGIEVREADVEIEDEEL